MHPCLLKTANVLLKFARMPADGTAHPYAGNDKAAA